MDSMFSRSRRDLRQKRRVELAVSHRHGHHVVKLNLRHQRLQQFLGRIHDVVEIDASLNTELMENRNRNFGRHIARASSQSIERGIDEPRSRAERFYAIGDCELQVAVSMKPKSASAALACFADVTSHIVREHAAGRIHAVDRGGPSLFSAPRLLAKLFWRHSVRLHEVQARDESKFSGELQIGISFLDLGGVVSDANEIESCGSRGSKLLPLANPRNKKTSDHGIWSRALCRFDQPLIGCRHDPFARLCCPKPQTVAYLDPPESQASQYTRKDFRIPFRELEIDGIAAITQRALEDFNTVRRGCRKTVPVRSCARLEKTSQRRLLP